MARSIGARTAPGARGHPPAGAELAESVLHALPGAVLVTDAEGRIVFSNARAREILERSGDQLDGRGIAELFPGLDGPPLRREAAGAGQRPQVGYRTPSGRDVVIGFSVSEIRGAGTAEKHSAFLFQDITDRERLQEERDRLLQMAAVSEVLPTILHELKNPLAAATAALQVLIEEVSGEPLRTDLHALLCEVRRMTLTLEGVGLLNRDDRNVRWVAVDFALTETFRILEAQMRGKGVVGRCDVPSLPLMEFDGAIIRALAFNLLGNAVQACRSGDTIRLTARLLEEGQGLEFAVEDTGPGMAPEVLARCRDLFFTTKSAGSGIGLALCQGIVDRCAGTLSIESEPGRGTRVTVRLPSGSPREAPRTSTSTKRN